MTLTPQEQQLYDCLVGKSDVFIEDIFETLWPDKEINNFRTKQQRIGSLIARVNKKLAARNLLIQPGEARRTYRLGSAIFNP